MPANRCGLLAAWAPAWFVGAVSLDEVVDAVTGLDGPHQVAGLPPTALVAQPEREDRPATAAPVAVGLGEVVQALRLQDRPVRLVLPVAGDVRGLPGPATFRDAALEAGEAVVCGTLGLVPSVLEFGPSSAPPSVVWQVSTVDPVTEDYVAVVDAQYDLATAIRETASALVAADATGRADPGALTCARRAGEHLELPFAFPQRAVALLSQAERMQAVLDLALADPVGVGVDRFAIAARESALRPLAVAVRRARLAGYNAAGQA